MEKLGARQKVDWKEIENGLPRMTSVEGGYTVAQRGLVLLRNGNQVFVKIGVDENTKKWAQKEIAVYQFLQRQAFISTPALLAFNDDKTAFALEALTSGNGWDWTESWNQQRLATTLETMDELAGIQPNGKDTEFLNNKGLSESDNGWIPLGKSDELKQMLILKLRAAGQYSVIESLDFATLLKRSSGFTFENNALVHNDVRGDNAPWNIYQNTVKLIDWNWTQLGDRRIDINGLLVHAQMSGLDVTSLSSSRLNADALYWLAGFWLRASVKPTQPGGSAHLRDIQLQCGVTAIDLARKV